MGQTLPEDGTSDATVNCPEFIEWGVQGWGVWLTVTSPFNLTAILTVFRWGWYSPRLRCHPCGLLPPQTLTNGIALDTVVVKHLGQVWRRSVTSTLRAAAERNPFE